MYPKVIIVVLGAEGHYRPLIQSVRDTWGPLPPYPTVYCYGWMEGKPRIPESSVARNGDVIMCGLSDTMQVIHHKTLLTFKHLLEHDEFDYLFRCCAGSYIHKPAMAKFIKDKPRDRLYCGAVGYHAGRPYASGSGYFLSKDLVKLAVDRINEVWPMARTDDVAMGYFMQTQGVPIARGARRVDIDHPSQLSKLETVDLNLEYHYHFRHQVSTMHAIYNKITGGGQ